MHHESPFDQLFKIIGLIAVLAGLSLLGIKGFGYAFKKDSVFEPRNVVCSKEKEFCTDMEPFPPTYQQKLNIYFRD